MYFQTSRRKRRALTLPRSLTPMRPTLLKGLAAELKETSLASLLNLLLYKNPSTCEMTCLFDNYLDKYLTKNIKETSSAINCCRGLKVCLLCVSVLLEPCSVLSCHVPQAKGSLSPLQHGLLPPTSQLHEYSAAGLRQEAHSGPGPQSTLGNERISSTVQGERRKPL